MGQPRMIILIRHAQSEGNKNRDIHQTIPDHRVKLTPEGWTQAYDAGRRLRALLRDDDTLHFFTSPYRRTRETTEGILSTLTSDEPNPSPFRRDSIKVYEEPKLREQDFGNFQPCSAEMERMWQERADYGHFFYRIPNGESAADAYDRISGFNESLWRLFGEEDFASVCVLVTHGLMSRIFLMKWYHFSVEYFEDLRNVNHCEFLIMRKESNSSKYILQNSLRTWSELKRERLETAAAAAAKDKNVPQLTKDTEKDTAKEAKLRGGSASANYQVTSVRKKWGGCPDGCDHGKHSYKKENSMHAMQLNGRATSVPEYPVIQIRRSLHRWHSSTGDEEHDPNRYLELDANCPLEDVVSSPDGTPSFISMENRMAATPKSPHMSSMEAFSGKLSKIAYLDNEASQPGSDDCEFSAEEAFLRTKSRIPQRSKVFKKESARGRGPKIIPGQDLSDSSTDKGAESDIEDLAELKVTDVSISVTPT
ncbi:hypothetical protein K3495_g8128 [Podosphaera aphanis]|nr:hypothetical protein K3495_g8128 [Podosphaera aphanis]